MEDSTARRLAGAMEDLAARLNSSNLNGELRDVSQYTKNLCMVLDENNQKMNKYIQSNERLIMEQALNSATQQFIEIKLACKRKELNKEEACEMLALVGENLAACYTGVKSAEYHDRVKNLCIKIDKILNADKKQEEDFKF